jgi:hypothetical protein
MLENKIEDLAVYSFVLMDKHLNELSRYTLDTPNEVCTTFTELEKFESEGKKLFALGTGKVENISNELFLRYTEWNLDENPVKKKNFDYYEPYEKEKSLSRLKLY